MKKIDKLKLDILRVFSANLIGYTIYSLFYNPSPLKNQFHSDLRNTSRPTASDSLLIDNCYKRTTDGKLRKNIFFLKTHKTASSTVQNILMRFGLGHSLNFMLPKKNNYLGYTNPIKLEDMDETSIPRDKKFNIFAHHSRYRRHTNQFLYPDTSRVTILRDPSELFESVFNFYNFNNLFKVSFGQFVRSLPRPRRSDFFISSKRKIRGRNQMSRDLGLHLSQYHNHTEIVRFVRYIDDEFDLIMIREYMEASLVLLARLMAWPLHYVSFIPINVRNYATKSNISESDRLKLSRYNYADHLLYDYFLKKFQNHVLEYGLEKLTADVRKLQSINLELRKRCVLRENNLGFYQTVGYNLKNNSDWECLHSTKQELQFTSELREEQIARLEPIRRLEDLIQVRESTKNKTFKRGNEQKPKNTSRRPVDK